MANTSAKSLPMIIDILIDDIAALWEAFPTWQEGSRLCRIRRIRQSSLPSRPNRRSGCLNSRRVIRSRADPAHIRQL